LAVALPAVQADFDVQRAGASLPYALTMIGFMIGGITVGRFADRFGILPPFAGGTILMGLGYILTAFATTLPAFAVVSGLTIGLGSAASFAPLVADASLWFDRHRGLAISLATIGSSLSGVVWPPIIQHFIEANGWRTTHIWVAIFCLVTMVPLALMMRRPSPVETAAPGVVVQTRGTLGLRPNTLQALLAIAGIGCCIAMAMPQVHIVAYCGDLGYGVARGAEMLAVMLGFGIISRIASGFIADRIGGVATLLLSSVLQGVALLLYVFFDGLFSLYVISALFGLFQGGIVPMYAIIVREYFAPQEAGTRLGVVLLATLGGMALGGWMSGLIFDLTGSYQAAFLNGLGWNLVNVSIVVWLLFRPGRRMVPA